jgi:para-nitrobenzyl esterase
MKLTVTLLTALLLAPLVALRAAEWRQVVRVETGLLEGVSNPENDVVAFKGIPYAAPPVGDLRWREPQPPIKWNGVRKADRFGAACTQPPSPSGKQPAAMSEDCLFLNVWAPAKATDEKCAVFFFVHGGAGVFGSGNLNGAELAKKGIIVVSVNYRLGIFAGFGHPELTAESPRHTCGTYGMLDLIAALRWVQQNIAAFGGDPSQVTIAGQSSGANAVHYLLTSPVAKGLFRGAIAVSFPCDYLTKPHMIPFVRQKEENGVAFAKIKNCNSLADLRRIPALELIVNDPAVAQAKLIHLGSGAARDGWAFPLTYPDALDKGLPSDVPTLTGITADDFGPQAKYLKTTVASFATSLPGMFGENRAAFLAKQDAFLALCSPVTTDQAAREMAKLAQIEYRMSSLFYWAKRRAKTATSPVYTYFFDQAVPSERGAYHSSDLAYWFNDVNNQDRPWTEADRRVADEVSSYWVNFVKTGDPNGGNLPRWQPFDARHPSTMTLSANSGPRPIAGKERLSFYRDLLEK